MTASVNHMPVTETWERMEKASMPESSNATSSQPDFLPLGSSKEPERSNVFGSEERENGYPQVSVPSQAKRKRLITGEVTLTGTPWRTKEYTCDPPGLHEEVCDFYEYMKPRPSEIQMRGEVILRTMSII